MTHPRLRLGVAVTLFLGWIGYLVYLVARTRDPVILSRPQILNSDLVILAQVEEKDGRPHPEVTVKQTIWTSGDRAAPAPGSKIRLRDLGDLARAQGWRGVGEYLIPLKILEWKTDVSHAVTPLPWSPGFEPLFQVEVPRNEKTFKQLKAWATENLKGDPQDLADQFAQGDPKQPVILVRNLTRSNALEMAEKLEQANVIAQYLYGEYRIYPATHDAREQLKQISPP